MTTQAETRTGSRAPKQLRSRTSLKRLLETAASMLETDGYADFTLQELSKQARVSIGSIYHLFENKQQLVREVQIRAFDQLERDHAVVINGVRRERLPLHKLVPRAIADYGEFLRNNAGLLRVFMEIAKTDAIVEENGKRYYWQALRDFELLLLDRCEEIRHSDPEHAVRVCFGVTYATLSRFLGLESPPDEVGGESWEQLLDDLSLMMLFYLLGDPQQVRQG